MSQNEEFIAPACNVYDDLVAACEDALSGWRYIRQVYGDLYGVGWDRVENKLVAALLADKQSERLDNAKHKRIKM